MGPLLVHCVPIKHLLPAEIWTLRDLSKCIVVFVTNTNFFLSTSSTSASWFVVSWVYVTVVQKVLHLQLLQVSGKQELNVHSFYKSVSISAGVTGETQL